MERPEIEDKIKQKIEELTKPEIVRFWGVDYDRQIAVCPEKLGDGLQLIGLSCNNTRPHWYILQIDSKTDMDNENLDVESFCEAFEGSFGRNECLNEDKGECSDNCMCDLDFPVTSFDAGYEWWLIENFGVEELMLNEV